LLWGGRTLHQQCTNSLHSVCATSQGMNVREGVIHEMQQSGDVPHPRAFHSMCTSPTGDK
jgi:hypothetical protein